MAPMGHHGLPWGLGGLILIDKLNSERASGSERAQISQFDRHCPGRRAQVSMEDHVG